MKIKDKFNNLLAAGDEKMYNQFGFKIKDATFTKLVDYMFQPKDSSSLAVTRILFGLSMLFDIPDERGGFNMERRWGDPFMCHFPLLPFISALPMPYMGIIYAGLWFGALGIMLGYKYRIAAVLFATCYWYLFVIEKSYWNNHSYLFGLVATLLACTDAGSYWSIDTYLDPSKLKTEVPYWNYFVLKYQFFILYFMAGLKKGTAEWLTGYSVQNLSEHWVFEPFKLFLTVPQTDYLIVHWFVFAFDLTVAVWMMYSNTRHVAMVFCALFHLMNSRLFSIGMFPWVCLATMPLFYPFDWPKRVHKYLLQLQTKIDLVLKKQTSNECECKGFDNSDIKEKDGELELQINENESNEKQKDVPTESEIKKELENTKVKETNETKSKENEMKTNDKRKRKMTVYLILFYVFLQAFLPYSHFVTKGYNNWTNGLYGYSWDMMVHTWDTHAVLVKVVDNTNNINFYVDPYIYAPNDRWTRHGDMVHQYARCLKENIRKQTELHNTRAISSNLSIYIDVWCSMNGRFVQRLFDPKVDLLKVDWSPFEKIPFLMPLIDADGLRSQISGIRSEVHSWSNSSDVLFLADFPGYEQEKYIPNDLRNVTLEVIEGTVVYEPRVTNRFKGYSYKLNTGDTISVDIGMFHKVKNIGKTPAFYMYTFFNNTEIVFEERKTPKLPIFKELYNRFYKMATFLMLMVKSTVQVFFSFCKC